ncbi:ras GEF [Dendrothele bispora CBS 962.96]|uniref:Ras GEF n=1 Tax=Dendrothele bispora (strain CBS 962.96) TaxID=1314807 RepID=A0A4S8MPK1_DENBC|nr:ras GEF [Dendrothele bispora CBS 962.96]
MDSPLVDDPNTLTVPSSLTGALYSPSSTSKESFLTAVSSPDSEEQPTSKPVHSTPSLQPPQSLRKSVSVDSFVQYGREVHPPVVNRPSRGHTGSALEPPKGLTFTVSKGLRRDLDHTQQSFRARGTSVSSVRDGYQSSLAGDSDVDRSDTLHSPTDRYRHLSLKSQEHSKGFVRGGELPLPSRTPTLSTTSSMSSIMSASTSSSTQEAAPVTRPVTSHKMASGATSGGSSSRTRSGSLGVYNAGKRIFINTQVPMYESNQAVTLVVVGTAGCGKSMTIRKGLKNYNLSGTTEHVSGSTRTRYTRRMGTLTREDGSPDCPLNVIEVDITPPMLESTVSAIDYLPEPLKVDGLIICYDATSRASFKPVEELLRDYSALQLPVIVLACKSDLNREIDPEKAAEVLHEYDVGLIEVNTSDAGKEKMKQSFDFLFKAIFRDRRSAKRNFDEFRNSASPEVLSTPNREESRTVTPTASFVNHIPLQPSISSPSSSSSLSRIAASPSSPTRARSTGDLLLEAEKTKIRSQNPHMDGSDPSVVYGRSGPTSNSVPPGRSSEEQTAVEHKSEVKESRPAQWATLDELLDKLLFLAISGDDPSYITHFLLTYRRFASPRSLLLAMQKRMRQLDNPSGDPMFACFAQMRICHLLELWIRDYSYDFAVRGTAGALSALIKSIISKTYLLHYGSDFLPFLEVLPTLADRDSAWALKVDDTADESDDSYSLMEDDDDSVHSEVPTQTSASDSTGQKGVSNPTTHTRERKSSLPLTAKSLFPRSSLSSASTDDSSDFNSRQQLRELVKLANEVNMLDPSEVAQEITRIEKNLFLDIQPRHWLAFTFISGKKDPETDTITRFNKLSNLLADWVVSLILCHDSPRMRAKQIEKFVEIAQRLRGLNNYSALRAFVAGINSSTFPGDQTMERFKTKSPDHAKNLQSWDVLLQQIRASRAYRLALRNTKGACIPALEVHMSDLIRAHEANDDFQSSDRTKIHWAKFNMMGRFITSTTQCQAQCRSTTDYDFIERKYISNLIFTKYLMDDETQKSRITPPDGDFDDMPPLPRPSMVHNPNRSNIEILRKLIFR